ncbi:centaurin-gamma-1A-like [Neocloeon triangulifer]|uniref:centaurin-gamma-1A-like n=1 Tax=Neocloeon triangulifer TaxID=2078957 RepID=UPI00286F71DB|nr:centaurin-gamma-1A-like [Neocloeon triangulifer]
MPEGFLRSLHRRSVRARQVLLGQGRRKTKRQSSDTCLTSENKEPLVQTIVSPEAPRPKLDPNSPKNNLPTSPLLIRRSFKKAQNEPIAVEKLILMQDLIKQQEHKRGAERGVDTLMTPSDPKKQCVVASNNKTVRVAATPTPKVVQRSNSMSAKETPVKTEGLATSFLRRSFRRRSVMHFSTPKPRRKSESGTPDKTTDVSMKESSQYAPCLLSGVVTKVSSSALNRDGRSKKFLAALDDGRLFYFPTKHDYLSGTRGKEIPLRCAAVRVPRDPKRAHPHVPPSATVTLTPLRDSWYAKDEIALTKYNERTGEVVDSPRTTNAPSGSVEGAFPLEIVSFDGRCWRFEVASKSDRDNWFSTIEKQIMRELQVDGGNPTNSPGTADLSVAQVAGENALVLRTLPGNEVCADCGEKDPAWASLNLGVLTCITCSGAHRGLGSHVSRIRSLELDHWTQGQIAAMQLIGNKLANTIWEADLGSRSKPRPESSNEEKRSWVRAKYGDKDFLRVPEHPTIPALRVAVHERDVRTVLSIVVSCPEVSLSILLHAARENHFAELVQFLLWNGAKQEVDISSLVLLMKTCGCSNLI